MTPSKSTNPLAQLSASLSDAVETAGRSVIAIHARRRIPSSGVVWRDGIVVIDPRSGARKRKTRPALIADKRERVIT